MNTILKTVLPILSYPDFTREFFIYTDASGYGVETVLAQIQSPPQSEDSAETKESDLSVSDGFEVVISYTSKHLKDHEAKWSTTEKEAYAIDIPIRTQIHSFYRSDEPAVPIATVETRARTKGEIKTVDNEWVRLQHEDKYCKYILNNLLKMKSQKDIMKREINNHKLNNKRELVNKYDRLVVPQVKIREIMEDNHDQMLAGHLGITKSLARIPRQFVWPNMRSDVTAHVNSCLLCARRKIVDTSKAPLQSLPPVDRVWERIVIHVVGPIQESVKGYKYFLVLSDYASRFVFTFPMKNQTAQTIARILVNKVITKYGAPETVLIDKGKNFLSKMVIEICKLFKIMQIRTTAYHPQTDGLVERFNRTLCDMLACYVVDEPERWEKFVPFVTFAYNTSKQATLKDSVLPFLRKRTCEMNNYQWKKAQELAKEHLAEAQTKQKRYYDEGTRSIKYKIGDLVLLKAPISTGKFINSKKKKSVVHANSLKPYTPREPTATIEKEEKCTIPRKLYINDKTKTIKTWKGWTCKQWVKTKKITGSFWIGSFDTVFSQRTKLITQLECWDMVNDKKCGGNNMQSSPTTISFTATPTGEGAWYATREYHVLNCLVEETTLGQESPNSLIESPFGFLNATQQHGQIVQNHNSIVWGDRLTNVSSSQTILKGEGFLELTNTNTSRLLDSTRQIEITFGKRLYIISYAWGPLRLCHPKIIQTIESGKVVE
ncbi:Uncharacterized protein APZ42_029985 [Daphnia magna]|uniref:RNA-directed DNA polymerase n=1 Tax=Daphnia magna TaxID=35525 RepID=A0A164P5F9_9CRUS|nr:Uncharacterized protein APZ42_029985 [Daphnia magna]